MYEKHFGLTAKPFKLTPDAGFYFPSSQHQRAMSFLQYGVEQADGFIVITGDIGAGKTTLVQTLLGQLNEPNLVVANIVSTQLKDSEILQLVAIKLGYKVKENPNKGALLDGLQSAFTQFGKKGGRALLIVDEAQNLTESSLEELRMLSNFQLGGRALVQIFLVGQPEFRDMLLAENFEQLRQRVIANHHLSPMNEAETRTYIEHRLGLVGWDARPKISEKAYSTIFIATGGVPRRINNLCERVLLSTFLDEAVEVDVERVVQVAQEIEGEFMEGRPVKQAKVAEAEPEPKTQTKTDEASAAVVAKSRSTAEVRGMPSKFQLVESPDRNVDEDWLRELQQELIALDTQLQMAVRQLEEGREQIKRRLSVVDDARFSQAGRRPK